MSVMLETLCLQTENVIKRYRLLLAGVQHVQMKEKIEEQHQLEQKVRAKQLATLRLLRLKMLLRLRQALDL